MTATARTALLAAATAALLAVGCGPLPLPASHTPATDRPTAHTDWPTAPTDLPAALFAGSAGLALSLPGDPTARRPIRLPPGTWQPTAAVGPGGTVLLVADAAGGPAAVLVGRLAGEAVDPVWQMALPGTVGATVVPGCVGGTGLAVVIGDALVAVGATGVVEQRAVPATVGRCQMPDAATVLYIAEDDHAIVAWSPPATAVRRWPLHCDDLGAAGGTLACLAVGGTAVAVGPWPPPPAGDGAPTVIASAGTATVDLPAGGAQVLLAPDGAWLAIVAGDGRAVTLYRRMPTGGVVVADAFRLAPDESMLGFVTP